MKYFYDLEFLENGSTIQLISIGIAALDGREYYAVNEAVGMDLQGQDELYKSVTADEWLMQNVVPHLPLRRDNSEKPLIRHRSSQSNSWFSLDHKDLRVLPLRVIAKQVKAFLYADPGDIELWAWYGAYDHVALMQLWGRMVHKPDRLPMWTHDLNQYAEQNGFTPDEISEAVPQTSTAHNALDDARHCRDMWHYLESKP